MLTISQLASYAGVTVRAVRHYHAKGLLPEPERDHSGYRRYDAAAVVRADPDPDPGRGRRAAGPGAGAARRRREEFAAAVARSTAACAAEIRERQDHRGGSPSSRPATAWRSPDGVALPRPAARLGVPERRDRGRARRLDPDRGPDAGADAEPHGDEAARSRRDPARALPRPRRGGRLRARRSAAALSSPTGWWRSSRRCCGSGGRTRQVDDLPSTTTWSSCSTRRSSIVPGARRLLALLEQRGWTGWTMIQRWHRQPTAADRGEVTRQLAAAVDAELVVRVSKVRLHGARREPQLGRDLGVRATRAARPATWRSRAVSGPPPAGTASHGKASPSQSAGVASRRPRSPDWLARHRGRRGHQRPPTRPPPPVPDGLCARIGLRWHRVRDRRVPPGPRRARPGSVRSCCRCARPRPGAAEHGTGRAIPRCIVRGVHRGRPLRAGGGDPATYAAWSAASVMSSRAADRPPRPGSYPARTAACSAAARRRPGPPVRVGRPAIASLAPASSAGVANRQVERRERADAAAEQPGGRRGTAAGQEDPSGAVLRAGSCERVVALGRRLTHLASGRSPASSAPSSISAQMPMSSIAGTA